MTTKEKNQIVALVRNIIKAAPKSQQAVDAATKNLVDFVELVVEGERP